MSLHEEFYEAFLYNDGLFPANRAAAVYLTDWLSMVGHHRMQYILRVGEMTQGATLDFTVQQATDSSGSNAKAIGVAKSITQLTQAGGDGNDTIEITIDVEDMDQNGNFTHLKGILTVGTAAVYCDLLPLRGPGEDRPVSTTPLTEVVT